MVNPSKLTHDVIDNLMMQGYELEDIMSMSMSEINSITRRLKNAEIHV